MGGIINVTHSKSRRNSRRKLLQTGAGLAGGALLPPALTLPAFAVGDHPPVGTWPAGSSGDSVFIGIAVPRTGTYAVQGEDELKGWQLAIEHINSGQVDQEDFAEDQEGRARQGSEIRCCQFCGQAKRSGAGTTALYHREQGIADDRLDVIGGCSRAQQARAAREVLYVTGISGSNDTTGKDCVRYGFRQNFYGETAANAIGPVLVKQFGKNKKAAFMTPDYTYGHTVTKSVNDYLTKNAGWTMVTNQVSPLGAPDFSSYLLNIANSGADVLINVNWGRDAVLSIQQAQKLGIFDKMKLAVSYRNSIPRSRGGRWPACRRLRRDGFLVDARRQYYHWRRRSSTRFEKKYNYKPEWGANNAYMSFAIWARMVEDAGSLYHRTSSSPTRRVRSSSPLSARCTSARKTTSSYGR